MLKEGVRHCDVFDREFTKGERYVAALIERDHVPPNADIRQGGLTVDGMGNVRIDICLDCRQRMNLSGEEVVN